MAELHQGEVNQVLAGMDRAMDQWGAHLKAIAPRCHFTPMRLDSEEGEEWWECDHCGHTKEVK